MNKKQGFNPYLPSFEYVPDGEPHIFGDRVYVYGSHDRFDGAHFCLNDYVCYSASIYDLADWKYEGVIYRKEQDPRNQNIPEDARPGNRGKAAGPVIKENEILPEYMLCMLRMLLKEQTADIIYTIVWIFCLSWQWRFAILRLENMSS